MIDLKVISGLQLAEAWFFLSFIKHSFIVILRSIGKVKIRCGYMSCKYRVISLLSILSTGKNISQVHLSLKSHSRPLGFFISQATLEL